MRTLYAVCGVCETMVVPPTNYQARLDGAAQTHAQITGHPVDVLCDDDPDSIVYRIPGEPSLWTEPAPRR